MDASVATQYHKEERDRDKDQQKTEIHRWATANLLSTESLIWKVSLVDVWEFFIAMRSDLLGQINDVQAEEDRQDRGDDHEHVDAQAQDGEIASQIANGRIVLRDGNDAGRYTHEVEAAQAGLKCKKSESWT